MYRIFPLCNEERGDIDIDQNMLNLKLVSHYRHYGISFNARMIASYKKQVREMLFKVLNRRSDRKSYTREGFIEMLKYYLLVMPKIYVSLF